VVGPPPGTTRLTFRRWSVGDGRLATELWGDPQVTRLITATGEMSPSEIAERLHAEIDIEREHGVQYWPMFLHDGTFIGCCGLRPRDRAVWELGFHIRSDLWRNGYAAESATAVIAHAFGPLEAAALFAGHHPDNRTSQHLLERLGFHHTHDEIYEPTGLMHPSYLLVDPGGR